MLGYDLTSASSGALNPVLSKKLSSLSDSGAGVNLTFANITVGATIFLKIETFGPFPNLYPSDVVFKIALTASAAAGISGNSALTASASNCSQFYFTALAININETVGVIELLVQSVNNNPDSPLPTSTALPQWDFIQNNSYLEQVAYTKEFFTTSRASASLSIETSFSYNSALTMFNQALFEVDDYYIFNGYPYDASGVEKTSYTNLSVYTEGLVVKAWSAAKVDAYVSGDQYCAYTVPTFNSGNRWVPAGYSAGTWNSYSGTSRSLNSIAGHFPASNSNVAVDLNNVSTSFAAVPLFDGDYFYTNFTPWNLNGTKCFTTLMVIRPESRQSDKVYDASGTVIANDFVDSDNWYTICSVGNFSTIPTPYNETANRITIRWYDNGNISLNYGDTRLVSLQSKYNASTATPLVVGFNIDYLNGKARLVVASAGGIYYSGVAKFSLTSSLITDTSKLFIGISPSQITPGSGSRVTYHSSSMYVFDVLNYYSSTATVNNNFLENEIKRLDRIYGVLSE